MSQIVLILSKDQIEKMRKHYASYLMEKTPPGGVFSAKIENCTITAYNSGKVLFQGKNCDKEAKKWGNPAALENPFEKKGKGNNLPPNISMMNAIGSDEVGTGDYFGPVTVVASYVKNEQIEQLKQLGVQDSKHLTDKKIIEIGREIKEMIPFSLLTLHNKKYNELQKAGMSQGKMKALLHNQAIGHVLKKIAPEKPDIIIIDEFVKEELYFRHLIGEKSIHRENVVFSTKGESVHLSVAASSILARYAFLQHMDKLSEKAGFPLPKGAGPKVDEAAAKLIRAKGKEVLPFFVKLHFANTDKALKLV